jgi:thiamine pyrophosphate-dependent acetolactate synthase large subunit-like protein
MNMARRRIVLKRRDVVARILKDRGDALLITGLGSPTWDAAAAGDDPANFYLWGGMGGAALIGLGLAMAQPRRNVMVLTGDGEFLMGLGALATIAVQKPRNLSIVVIDNQHYGETGMQESATGHGVDLAAMARGAGFRGADTVYAAKELDAAVPGLYAARGPKLIAVKVILESLPIVLPPRDGPDLKARFRAAVLGV